MGELSIRDNTSRNGLIKPIEPNVTEEKYYIHPKLKEDLDGIIKTAQKIEKFGTEMGHRNYLFTGPPGTGKTLGVQYIATKLHFKLYDAKGISNAQQISQIYQELRDEVKKNNQKVILMFDEVDKFSKRDQIIDPTQQQTLNQLLAEMDGVDSNNGIFVFGMTNEENKLDNALRRTGRFSKEIEFMPPDRQGRLAILRMHADCKGGHQFKVNDDDLGYAADLTYGYTGADLRGLLDEAFTLNVLREDEGLVVSRSDIDKAKKKTKPSALRDMPYREPKKKFCDIGGYEIHKELVKRVVERGNGGMFLLYGPPGTGKSLMPEAVAGEMGYNLIEIHGNDPESSLVGATKDKLKKMIERAKHLAPIVMNFDEIDGLVAKKHWTGGTKEGHTGYLQSVLNNPLENVIIFATVNRPELLLDTFVQRFPHRLYFDFPSPEEQEDIWTRYLPEGIEAKDIVEKNNRLSGRNIAHACLVVKDYGLKPTLEVYKNFIADIQRPSEEGYGDIIGKIGDSIKDFEKVRMYLAEQEGVVK